MTASSRRVEHNERIEQLHDELNVRLNELTTSDEWLDYLTVARRFHRYSPHNQLLIALQGAEGHVASYRNWQRIPAVGGGTCQVAKGERGLTILAPLISKTTDTDDVTGEQTTRQRLRGFRTVKVFHQGQLVDPPDLPEAHLPQLLTGENRWQHVWTSVTEHLRAEGFDVNLHTRTAAERWNGQTRYSERQVLVADDLEPPQRVKTLLHEWAHVQLGHEQRLTERRELLEVEAESTAYLLARTIGLDAAAYSIPYVALWSGGDPAALEATAERVLVATKRLVDELETRLGVDLTPEALDHARPEPPDLTADLTRSGPSHRAQTTVTESVGDNVVSLNEARARRRHVPLTAVANVKTDVAGNGTRRSDGPLPPLNDGEFLKAVAAQLDAEPAERLAELATNPRRLDEAAELLADGGLSTRQSVWVLARFGADEEAIRVALQHRVRSNIDGTVEPLWPEADVEAAIASLDRSSPYPTPEVPAAPIEQLRAQAEHRANVQLLVRAHRAHSDPAQVAALAFGLGIEPERAVKILADNDATPNAIFDVALAIHDGNPHAAAVTVASGWPDPPGGWEQHLHPSLRHHLDAGRGPDASVTGAHDPIQAILDGWAGRTTPRTPAHRSPGPPLP